MQRQKDIGVRRRSVKFYSSILIFPLLFCAQPKAQEQPEKWTLQKCLEYALENNIQIKQSKVTHLSGLEDTEQARAQLFPNLTASVSQSFVNYPSSEADMDNSYSGSYSLSANWTIFNGGQRRQALKQQRLQNESDELSIEKSEDDIRISIVQTYLQVMYAMEAVQINKNTVEVSKFQRDRAEEMLKAGSISKVDLAQLESQYSTDKYQLVVAQTNLDNYKLELKQLLELDITDEMEFDMPQIADEDVVVPLADKETIYKTSLSVMPQIRSSELAVEIAELEKKRAKGGFFPTIALNAGIETGHMTSGSGYSSGNRVWSGSRIWNNFNENIGLTITIPIFANREYKTAYNKAKLAITTSTLDLLDAQKELLKTVEGVYLDAVSAQEQYVSAKENLSYLEKSYTLIEEQFYVGLKNTLELLTEKNNLLSARQEVLQSKYMAIMSMVLLDIYQKQPVKVSI